MQVVWALDGVVSYKDGSWAGFEVRSDVGGYSRTGPDVSAYPQIVQLFTDLGLPTKTPMANNDVADFTYRFMILNAQDGGNIIEVGAANDVRIRDDLYETAIALVSNDADFTGFFASEFTYPFNGRIYLKNDGMDAPLGSSPRAMYGWVNPAAEITNVVGLFGYGHPTIDLDQDHNVILYDFNLKKDIRLYGKNVRQIFNEYCEVGKWNFVGMDYDGMNLLLFINAVAISIPNVVLNTTGDWFVAGVGLGPYLNPTNVFIGDLSHISLHTVSRGALYAKRLWQAGRVSLNQLPFDMNYTPSTDVWEARDGDGNITIMKDSEGSDFIFETFLYTGPVSYWNLTDNFSGDTYYDTRELNDLTKVNVAADFSYSGNLVSGAQIDFLDTSTINSKTYSWDFGDGSTSSEKDPSHVYATGGSFTVTLTIDGGYKHSEIINIITSLLLEPMDGTPLTGSLVGQASYAGPYVQLTTDEGGFGAITFNSELLVGRDEFTVIFDLYKDGDADAIWFFIGNDNATGGSEVDYNSGYTFYYQEFHEEFGWNYAGIVGGTSSNYVPPNAEFKEAKIEIRKVGEENRTYIRMYYDGVLKLYDYDIIRDSASATYFGLAARCGGLTAFHRVRDLQILG